MDALITYVYRNGKQVRVIKEKETGIVWVAHRDIAAVLDISNISKSSDQKKFFIPSKKNKGIQPHSFIGIDGYTELLDTRKHIWTDQLEVFEFTSWLKEYIWLEMSDLVIELSSRKPVCFRPSKSISPDPKKQPVPVETPGPVPVPISMWVPSTPESFSQSTIDFGPYPVIGPGPESLDDILSPENPEKPDISYQMKAREHFEYFYDFAIKIDKTHYEAMIYANETVKDIMGIDCLELMPNDEPAKTTKEPEPEQIKSSWIHKFLGYKAA